LLTAVLAVPFLVVAQKTDQTILFDVLPTKIFGSPSFELAGKASSGLPVSYLSSNIQVATISGTTVTIVGAGQTNITAKQNGDAAFNAASDVSRSLLVSKANQTITFPNPVFSYTYGDPPFNLGASSSSGLPLSFTVSNQQIGGISNGFFQINAAGECTVTASQAGNSNYLAAVSVTKTVFIRKVSQVITFPNLPLKTFGNSSFDPSASSSSSLPVVYGTSDPTIAIIQDAKVVIVGAGVVDITADHPGSNNYFPASTKVRTLTIQRASQTLTITSASSSTFGASPIILSAVSSANLPVTRFTSQYDTIASIDNTPQLTIRGAGETNITAYQPGDKNFLPVQVSKKLTVNKASQIITFLALPTLSFGAPPYIMNATSSSGLAVTFSSTRKAVAVTAGNSLVGQGLGTASVIASQSGNSNYLPALNVNQNVTITGTASVFQMSGSTLRGGTGKGTLFKMKSDGSQLITTLNFPGSGIGLPNGGLIKSTNGKLYGVIAAGGTGSGVVFSIDTDGSNYTVLHNFSGLDGSFPTGSLFEANNGYLYGATLFGGNNVGVIFRLQKDGTDFSVLHKFSPGGYIPSAGPIQAVDGKLYGSTAQGGTTGFGTLYSMNIDGSGYNEFLSFDGVSNGSTPRGALIQGPDLFLYGVTSGGGSQGKGVMFKVQTNGTSYTKLVEFDGAAKGSNGASTPFLGSDGKLYTMTQRGGANDNGAIFSISTNGTGFLKIFDFNGTAGKFPLGSLIEASDGYLYGMTSEGGATNQGTSFKIRKDGSNFAKLVDFIGTNGANPQLGPLLEVQTGLFLGITYRGGASDAGIIFSVSPVGTFNLFKDFPQPAGLPDFIIPNSDFSGIFGIATSGGAFGGGAVFGSKNDGSNYTELAYLKGNALYACCLTRSSDNRLWGVGREGITSFSYFLFRVDETGANYQRVVTLDDLSIGANPRSLIDFSDDYIYGVAVNGGIANSGTVFKVKKDGSGLSKVTDIPGGALGSQPYVQSIKHSNGSLYGVAQEGGANNNGAVFKVSPDGVYSKIADLKQSITGAYPKRIIELNGGSLCIATANGAANNRGALFTVDENGQNLQKTFDFSSQTGSDTRTMTQSAEGYVFVTLGSEGAQNNGTIIRVLPDGSSYSKLFDFSGTNGSEPNSLMFEKLPQSITSFEDIPQKQFVDPPFLLKATSSSGSLIRFTSSDPSIASVEGYTVTIHKVGTVTISAQIPGSGNYTPSATVQKTLTIVKSDEQFTFANIASKKFGDEDFRLVASTSSQRPISFSSSDPTVATVSRGVATIVGTGTTTITASVALDPNFNSVSPIQRILTVSKGNQNILFYPLAARYVDAVPFTLSASTSSGLPINFGSNNLAVATVSGGTVTVQGAGQTVFAASVAGNINYLDAQTVNQTLLIKKRDQFIDFNNLTNRSIEESSFPIQNAIASSGLPVTVSNTSTHISIANNLVTILEAGSVTINATQEGSTIFLEAPQVSRTFCIIPSKPILTSDSINASRFVLTSSAAIGNQWFRDGTLIFGETGKTLIAEKSGVYTVKVTVEGCSSAPSKSQALIITSIEEPSQQLVFYPNPSETLLFVSLPHQGIAEIQILSLLGIELKRFQSSNAIAEVDVSTLPSGTYLIQLRMGTSVVTHRFIKK
jgi:uncharacterized repeat protein (TIGR03803 family)